MRFNFTLIAIALTFFLSAQDFELDSDRMSGLSYRSIGPSRGGRVTTVCGIKDRIHQFYMGTTGGGVWLTEDAGTSWNNISDKHFRVGSIGSIAVAPSDPNLVYVGTGSACPRGNISMGNGVYKSTDGGSSWEHVGLDDAGMIGQIEVHPKNPDLVYAAVLGNPFGPNEMRGVFKSKDGGMTWEKTFFISENTGAVDLAMDLSNPNIVYAAMWTVERKPWTVIDGSEEGGIWKTKDGGEHWTRIKGGLPEGIVGRGGIAISPANPDRIWVIQEAKDEKKGGLYRSDDSGKTWSRINRDHNLRQRAWYYNHVTAHPTDENTLFIMNVRFHKSIDGGKNFETIRTPHGDNHALWINPDHPEIMVEGNDGGACVTLNGGKTWSTQYNQPTAEFYRVTVDDQFPYRVYGAQQDNSTISVPSRNEDALDPIANWQSVGGGESGHIAVDPRDPNHVYAGTYIGQIDRTEKDKGLRHDIMSYPQMHDGTPPRNIKYRFQWNAPIRISPHNPDIVYHCSQFVHKSTDQGNTWETISPDLTTNNDAHQDIPGGPVQHDHTGVELYGTIFAFEESPHAPGELWAGSDDGLLYISKDHGTNWKDITPKILPPEGTINCIELSPHAAGRALLAVYKYRDNDRRPFIFLTNNYGQDWKLLTPGTNGITNNHFTRVVREDPIRKGLIYVGTELGMFVSFNEGAKWQSLQLNLPPTPITDMVIKENDLVLATQGRSFWILDDLTPLQHWSESVTESGLFAFPTRTAYRTQFQNFREDGIIGRAPNGAIIYYYLKEIPDTNKVLRLSIIDGSGKVRRTYSSHPDKKLREEKLSAKKGLNRFVWDLRLEQPVTQDKAVFSLARMRGIKAPPGSYGIRFAVADHTAETPVQIKQDPRWNVLDRSLVDLYQTTMQAKAQLNSCHQAIGEIRSIRGQLEILKKREDLKERKEVTEPLEALIDSLNNLEAKLIQTSSESGQDPINFPSRIDDQFAFLYSRLNSKDAAPGSGALQRLEDLQKELQPYLTGLQDIKTKVSAINRTLKELSIDVIEVPGKTIKP